MARNYQQEYANRIARGVQIGLSRDQARGHPGTGRAKASEIIKSLAITEPDRVKSQRHAAPKTPKPPRYAAPKTPYSIIGPRDSSQVTTTSLRDVAQKSMKLQDTDRVYFGIWNRNTGSYEYLYKGTHEHGITGAYLKERMQEKLDNGDARTPREALLQVMQDDISSSGSGATYNRMSTLPASGKQTQYSMHVMHA